MTEKNPKKRDLTMDERHALAVQKLGFTEEHWYKKRGRKTLFRETMIKEGEKLAGLGHTMEEIASFWGVSKRSLERWSHKYPEFCRALKDGRIRADVAVETSLYKRAMGYSYTETTYKETVINEGSMAGQKVRYKDKEVVKMLAPDITAAIFFLKNRRPDMWRDMRDLGFFDDLGVPLPIRFVEVGPREPKQIEEPKDKSKEEDDAAKLNH